MSTFFPVIELVDRHAISLLKFNKTNCNRLELDFYNKQLEQYDLEPVKTLITELYTVHSCIWELESELKSGTEQNIDLAEIGRRAIEIRNWNNKRIQIKNNIAEQLGCPVREIKKDHLSE
jgi:hypothetical protein